jgi:DNA-binding transcriptional ArsR family regulator
VKALAALLGSATRASVLAWLASHPGERFFVRQLASLVQEDPANVSRELRRLEKLGILSRTVSGRQTYYEIHTGSPLFPELYGLAVKTSGVAEVLRQALAPLRQKIILAFVFGSVAAGSVSPDSDVDLMVVGTASFGEVVNALQGAQERLGREVNPVVLSPAEMRTRLAKSGSFAEQVLRRPRILLLGDENELERLGR